MTSVIIADDQAIVRDGLRLILQLAGIDVVAEASDGVEAVEMVLRERPDVVLMDLRMPRMDGIEATRRITAAGLASRVLILTTFDLDRHVYDALRVGAAGFLLKDSDSDHLVRAIQDTAAGESPVSANVLNKLILHYVEHPPSSIDDSEVTTVLSERELEVLTLVGRGRSNGEIAEDLYVSLATVKTHIRHILAKLDLRDRVQAVVVAHQAGLVRHRR